MSSFRTFILRGNVVDLAVGIVIGAAFTAVVTSVVTGVITPIVGLAGRENFDKAGWCLRGACPLDPKTGIPTGHVLLYGLVLTSILSFLVVAAVVYYLVVQPVNALMDRYRTEPEVTHPTKECPECLSSIPQAALRCAFCTVEQLDVAG